MKLQAILFDLDGTLLDSAPDFIAIVNTMLQDRSRPAVNERNFRQVVSGGTKEMISHAFEITSQSADFEALRLEFLERYSEHYATYSKCYEGIEKLLLNIEQAGLKWGIVTNKPVRFAQPIVNQLFPNSSVLICPEHVTHCKPSPEPLFLASKQLGVITENTLYVGDDKRDIDSGNTAGCYTIAAGYGYVHSSEKIELWNADSIVTTVSELNSLIKQMIINNS